jgi:competence protein ComEA
VSSLRGTPDAAASPIEPDIARRLERSVALDPSDSKRLDNLESFYRWSPGVANAAHLQNVQRIRARLPFAPLEDRSPQAPGNHLQQEPGLVAPVLKPPGPGAVDVNRASLEELEAVPGVTHEIAQRIVSGRPYRSWDDLARRLGVEPASLAKMKTALRIDRP